MTLDLQNTMTEFNNNAIYGFKELGPIIPSEQLSYSANLVEIVASIKYLAMEISHLKARMESLEEMMRVLNWRIDNPGGDYYD